MPNRPKRTTKSGPDLTWVNASIQAPTQLQPPLMSVTTAACSLRQSSMMKFVVSQTMVKATSCNLRSRWIARRQTPFPMSSPKKKRTMKLTMLRYLPQLPRSQVITKMTIPPRPNPPRYDWICDLDSSIPDWIIEHPETTRVFNDLGFDTSCGGKSLEYVCHQYRLSPSDVLQQLRVAVAARSGLEQRGDSP